MNMQTSLQIGDLVADYVGGLGVISHIGPDGWIRVEWGSATNTEIDWYDKTRIQKLVKFYNKFYGKNP